MSILLDHDGVRLVVEDQALIASGEADFLRSLGQLESDLPAVGSGALTVGWFGDDLRAGFCRIRPGVETRTRASVPYGWDVAGETRETAWLVSQSGGSANYGGTPADRAVIEGVLRTMGPGERSELPDHYLGARTEYLIAGSADEPTDYPEWCWMSSHELLPVYSPRAYAAQGH